MKKFVFFLVIFSLTLTLFIHGIEYINNKSYNKCMIANAKYNFDQDKNCQDVYRIDN
jgi:hypothetical protein